LRAHTFGNEELFNRSIFQSRELRLGQRHLGFSRERCVDRIGGAASRVGAIIALMMDATVVGELRLRKPERDSVVIALQLKELPVKSRSRYTTKLKGDGNEVN
jgi:hypothetical protein